MPAEQQSHLPASETSGASPRDLARVARGTGWGLLGGLSRQALAALTVWLLARLLVPEQFGLVQMGVSCALLMMVVGKAGLDLALARQIAIYQAVGERALVKGALGGALLWGAGISVGLSAAVMLLAPQVAALFGKPYFARPLMVFCVWVPPAVITTLAVAAVLARGSARARVVVRDITVPGLCLLLATGAALLAPRAEHAAMAYALASGVGMLLALGYLPRFFPELIGVRAVYQHRLLLATALPMLLTDLAAVGLTQADVLLVGRLQPSDQVGIYAAAVHLAVLGTLALNALNQIVAPVISRLHHQGCRAELDSLLKTLTRLCLAVSVPMLALFVGAARPVMGLLGPPFVAGGPALVVASLGVLVNVGTGSVGYALVMGGHQWCAFAVNVLSVVLLVGLLSWLTPLHGITGAALALALATALANLVRLALARVLLGVSPVSLPMFKSLAAGVSAAAAAWALVRLLGLAGVEPLALLFPQVLLVAVTTAGLGLGVMLLLGFEQDDRRAARLLWERIRRPADK